METQREKNEYVRTPSHIMAEMTDLLKHKKPMDVYNTLINKYDELSGPTSRRQVHDKKLNDDMKNRQNNAGKFINRGNIVTISVR